MSYFLLSSLLHAQALDLIYIISINCVLCCPNLLSIDSALDWKENMGNLLPKFSKDPLLTCVRYRNNKMKINWIDLIDCNRIYPGRKRIWWWTKLLRQFPQFLDLLIPILQRLHLWDYQILASFLLLHLPCCSLASLFCSLVNYSLMSIPSLMVVRECRLLLTLWWNMMIHLCFSRLGSILFSCRQVVPMFQQPYLLLLCSLMMWYFLTCENLTFLTDILSVLSSI